ncbi:hypothetical protein WICPIJ_000870 [Wickerhamomyces pijperi]|uniref:Major facilitator superfamily (MFS) profile domain-containing protein n=1 Tax=Wickerhamomyces pijperi TaxID=599730 RepID=A0A9P8QCQ4_WICPI|nr:hypothetical protein WICPIJ_000870 [Wickerhamomyces pijperi]
MKNIFENFSSLRSKTEHFVPSFLLSKHFVFLLLNIATCLDLLNVTSLLVATEYVSEHYDVAPAVASWTLSSYAIAFAGFIAFFGRTGDIIGHDFQFIVMIFLFSIASLLCAVVDNIYAFIVFRGLQGLFAAGLIPTNYAITANIYQGKQLSTAITILTAVVSLCTALGLIIGGAFLRTDLAIHGTAYVSFALAMLISVVAFFTFPVIKTTSKDKLKDLDYIGSGILISGLLLVIVGFTEGGESWKSPKSYATLVVGVALTGVFFLYEKFLCLRLNESTHLLIPPQMWTIPNYAPLIINAVLNYAGFFGSMYINISYFLNMDHDSPLMSGVRYLPFVISLVVVTYILTFTNGKFSQKWTCVTGFVIGFIGLILLTRVNYKTPNHYWKFSVTNQILTALGSDIYFVNYLNIIIHSAPLEVQGIATGIAQTFGQFGIALAFAVITSILGDVQNLDVETLNKRYEYSSWFCVACYGAGIILLVFFVKDIKVKEKMHNEEKSVLEQKSEAACTELEL